MRMDIVDLLRILGFGFRTAAGRRWREREKTNFFLQQPLQGSDNRKKTNLRDCVCLMVVVAFETGGLL